MEDAFDFYLRLLLTLTMSLRLISFGIFLFASLLISAQETFPVNGVFDEREVYHAFTNAEIQVAPGESIQNGTLIIKEGRIVAVGSGIEIPTGSVEHNCEGRIVYPSFIDPDAIIEKPKTKKSASRDNQSSSSFSARNWNPAIHPEYVFQFDKHLSKAKSDDWLSIGYGVINVHRRDGIMRGTASLLVLGEDQPNLSVISPKSTSHFSFNKGTSKVDYPTAHIGAIALIRQTLYDRQWYARSASKKELNVSLEALQQIDSKPIVFELNHPLSVRNVNDIADEFSLNFIMRGTGREYLVSDEIRAGTKMIAPLSFPRAYDVEDPFVGRMISLGEFKHWELAPFNVPILLDAGVTVSLTRDTLEGKECLKNFNKLVKAGLKHDDLLRAVTQNPAELLEVYSDLGSLHPGKRANFIITKGRLGELDFKVDEHWTNGKLAFEKREVPEELIGKYNLVIDSVEYILTINSISEKGIKSEIEGVEGYTSGVKIDNELISIFIRDRDGNMVYQLSGKMTFKRSVWDGRGQDSKGNWISWAAIRDRKFNPEAKEEDRLDSLVRPRMSFPNMAYGWDSLDENTTFVITNAVVWTCTDTGILENADVYVVDGKIKSVGKGQLFPSDVKRIDARGRHLTPGIIDEHSHIGIRGGVNEWGQSSSAEVRISDAVDPWNINIYRQLAGGVTAAQLLHGSANPIGGQSALVKYKWGVSADEMLIDDAVGFIKFALGENVKRSNRRENGGRFPLTRMGVEQTFVDAFTRVLEYDPNERVDLDLQALKEILDSNRFISCHSYVQSEILMLMDVAERFDFRVNTFTHILEGYKIAPQLAKHGASGSTFSDWWAYKYEVNDAIPHNAAIMTRAGVNTSINSDDAEMGRRLNQEAAKAMKYGGLSEEEALELVTINPAKMLHLDHRIGSIEVGKDADLVLWSDNPLSVYSKAEKTFIEGVKYYDINDQKEKAKGIREERARLISLMSADKEPKKKVKPSIQKEYHCDSLHE